MVTSSARAASPMKSFNPWRKADTKSPEDRAVFWASSPARRSRPNSSPRGLVASVTPVRLRPIEQRRVVAGIAIREHAPDRIELTQEGGDEGRQVDVVQIVTVDALDHLGGRVVVRDQCV